MSLAQPTARFVAYPIAFDRIDSLAPDSPQRAHEVLTWVPWLSSRPLIDGARACEGDERFERVSSLCGRRFGFATAREYGYFPE
ncbi:MAG: hypothetical protein NTV21_12245 [Planctomycetota bacterium]|nr:hypothetical protein [Planctomycetota bacterium]